MSQNVAVPLILASTSPYRKQLLARLGIPFMVAPPGVDETPEPGEAPASVAMRLALAKARAVAAHHAGAVVIGSDQVATLGDRALGKPGNHHAARRQLELLSGCTVEFHSAVSIVRDTEHQVGNVLTRCRFRTLTAAEIENYLQRERPYDTAGSAKAEGLGIALMESMESADPTAIIGLPLIALCAMLRQFGLDPLLPRAA